jgi:hypothetical protein
MVEAMEVEEAHLLMLACLVAQVVAVGDLLPLTVALEIHQLLAHLKATTVEMVQAIQEALGTVVVVVALVHLEQMEQFHRLQVVLVVRVQHLLLLGLL